MAYCYKYSVVCLCVCLLITTVSCAKTAEPVKCLRCGLGLAQGTMYLALAPIAQRMGYFFGGGGFFRLVVKYRKYLARAKVIHQHLVAAVMHPTAVGTAATC